MGLKSSNHLKTVRLFPMISMKNYGLTKQIPPYNKVRAPAHACAPLVYICVHRTQLTTCTKLVQIVSHQYIFSCGSVKKWKHRRRTHSIIPLKFDPNVVLLFSIGRIDTPHLHHTIPLGLHLQAHY